MRLDLDAVIAELDAPRVTLGGVEYVGRHVSIEEWAVLEARLRAYQEQKTPQALRSLLVELTDAMFPPPPEPPDPRPWWKRWLHLGPLPPQEPSVADRLLAQPITVQLKALEGFMASQAKALELPTPGT